MKYLIIIALLFNFVFAQTSLSQAQRDSIERSFKVEQIEWLDDESEEMEELISIVEKNNPIPTPDCDTLFELTTYEFYKVLLSLKSRNQTIVYHGVPTFFHKVSYRYGYFYSSGIVKLGEDRVYVIECKYPLETK